MSIISDSMAFANDPKLSITRADENGSLTVLRLRGPLVMATAAEFQATMRDEKSHSVLLDFSEVPFIDSAGLGGMISIFLHYKQAGRDLSVAGMNEKCRALMKMTNVENLFPSYASVDAARESFKKN